MVPNKVVKKTAAFYLAALEGVYFHSVFHQYLIADKV